MANEEVDRTNLFSRFGIGGIVLPDAEERWVKESEFPSILNRAINELGVTYIDTARAYELAEDVIGRWLPSTNQRNILVGSKVSIHGLNRASELEAHFSNSLKTTLEKLRLNTIPIYWLHAPAPKISTEHVVGCFQKGLDGGLIGSYGVSNVTPEDLEAIFSVCERKGYVKPCAIQNEFSLVAAKEAKNVRMFASENELHFFGFSPLASGLLAGRYPKNGEFPAGSRWSNWIQARNLPNYWNDRTFSSLRELAARAELRNVSMAALALRWCLDHSDTTLLGPRTVEHLNPAAEALRIELTDDDLDFFQDRFLN